MVALGPYRFAGGGFVTVCSPGCKAELRRRLVIMACALRFPFCLEASKTSPRLRSEALGLLLLSKP